MIETIFLSFLAESVGFLNLLKAMIYPCERQCFIVGCFDNGGFSKHLIFFLLGASAKFQCGVQCIVMLGRW